MADAGRMFLNVGSQSTHTIQQTTIHHLFETGPHFNLAKHSHDSLFNIFCWNVNGTRTATLTLKGLHLSYTIDIYFQNRPLQFPTTFSPLPRPLLSPFLLLVYLRQSLLSTLLSGDVLLSSSWLMRAALGQSGSDPRYSITEIHHYDIANETKSDSWSYS